MREAYPSFKSYHYKKIKYSKDFPSGKEEKSINDMFKTKNDCIYHRNECIK